MRLRGSREGQAVTLSGLGRHCCFCLLDLRPPADQPARCKLLLLLLLHPDASTYLQGSAGQGRCNQTRRLCRPS